MVEQRPYNFINGIVLLIRMLVNSIVLVNTLNHAAQFSHFGYYQRIKLYQKSAEAHFGQL